MRILIATGIYPPDIGGPATYTKELAEELPKRGVSVQIITYGNETKEEYHDNCSVSFMRSSSLFVIYSSRLFNELFQNTLIKFCMSW